MGDEDVWVEDRLDTLTIIFSSVIVFIFSYILLSVVDSYTFVGYPAFRLLLAISIGALIYYLMSQPKAYLRSNSKGHYLTYGIVSSKKQKEEGTIPWKSVRVFQVEPAKEHSSYFETEELTVSNLWRTELLILWINEDDEKEIQISGQAINYSNFISHLQNLNLLIPESNSKALKLNVSKIKM